MCPPLSDTNACIAALTDGIQIKVWSYITTIFGDFAADDPPGARRDISGQVLTALTDRVGIKPEATRVALHRLHKDRWIVVRKAGRVSHYRLSEDRLAETRAASDRIYAPQIVAPETWALTILNPADVFPVAAGKAICLQPNVVVSQAPISVRDDHISLPLAHDKIPGWAHTAAIPANWQMEYQQLADLFTHIAASLDDGLRPSALDAATLRLLVVHRWRRLILRHSELAEKFQAPDWVGHRARSEAARLFHRLPRVRDHTSLLVP